MASLSSLLTSLQRGFLRNVLEGAGITLGTASIGLFMLNQAVTTFRDSLGSVPIAVIQLCGVSGLDIYFTLVIGAIVATHVKSSSALALFKKRA